MLTFDWTCTTKTLGSADTLFYSTVKWLILHSTSRFHITATEWLNKGRMTTMVLLWLILPAHLKQWSRKQSNGDQLNIMRVSVFTAVTGFLSPSSHPSTSAGGWRGGPEIRPLPQTQTGNPVWRRRCTGKVWAGGEPVRMPLSLSRVWFANSSERRARVLQWKQWHHNTVLIVQFHGWDN